MFGKFNKVSQESKKKPWIELFALAFMLRKISSRVLWVAKWRLSMIFRFFLDGLWLYQFDMFV